jgi:hypothetical protein
MIDESKNNLDRSKCPYHAVITVKVDIRKINPNGTLDTQVIGNNTLKKYGMSNKAQICFSAVDEATAIKMAKEKIERLEDEQD